MNGLADTEHMTLSTLFRAAQPRTPRARIVAVGNRWQVTDEGNRREVTVRTADGQLVTRYLPDEHPAVVRFIDRAWAVAA
jgi:hypothetical protein